jgi:hypothetical protein
MRPPAVQEVWLQLATVHVLICLALLGLICHFNTAALTMLMWCKTGWNPGCGRCTLLRGFLSES